MELVKLEKGQDAWFYETGHKGELTKGKVVAVVQVDGWSWDHYIIEYPTPIDDVLVIRDPTTVSDSPDKKIGLWRHGEGFNQFLQSMKKL